MTQPQAQVAAVIVTHNRSSLVRECILSLASQTHRVAEIIVVNNGRPGRPAFFADFDFPLLWHEAGGNIGSAGGNSIAFSLAVQRGHDWIWAFQDDDAAEPEALERLLDAAVDQPLFGGVASAIVDRNGKRRPKGFIWRRGKRMVDPPSGSASVDGLGFDGALISAAVVRDVGPPRADFFQVWGEVEFYLRARRRGWRFYVLGEELTTALSLGEVGAPIWREYYEARNSFITSRGQSWGSVLHWACNEVARHVWITRSSDQKEARRSLRIRGECDGLRNRMGKVVDPELYHMASSS